MDIYQDSVVTVEIAKSLGDNETLTGAGVDMLGYNSVCFIMTVSGGEAGNCTLKAQQDVESAFGTAADLAGTSQTVAPTISAADLGVLDIHNPQERYVRAVATVPNLTTPAGVSVIAIRYNAKYLPKATNAGYGEHFVAPAEGTA